MPPIDASAHRRESIARCIVNLSMATLIKSMIHPEHETGHDARVS